VAERLKGLPSPIRLVVFTQEMECEHCRENRQLAEEVAALAPDKVRLEVYNLITDPEQARELGVDKVPAICVVGSRDYGIRFYGVPAGFEFSTFVAAIELAAGGDSRLKPESKSKLAGLTQAADVMVFTTLTCPACPAAASLAHRLAVESDKVTASVIDAAEFPQLVNLYGVMAVPKVVINRGHSFEGALPEDRFVEEVLKGAAAG
jgi:glutaredoxin-like protein